MLTFPGEGEIGDNCGTELRFFCHDCSDRGEPDPWFTVEHKCLRRACPNCVDAWRGREAAAAAQRVTAFVTNRWASKKYQDIEYKRWRNVIDEIRAGNRIDPPRDRYFILNAYHVVISWKNRFIINETGVKEARRDAYRVARNHGIFGGCATVHQRRDERGDWGVHVHILGVGGYLNPGLDDEPIFKVIPHDGKWHPRNQLEREHVIRYILSHCLVGEKDKEGNDSYIHALTWFGCLAYNQFSSEIVEQAIASGIVDPRDFENTCPRCGSTNVSPEYVFDYTSGYREMISLIP